MKCPLCNVDLVMSERQGIEIDYCPQCRGVWLDRGELDKIIERSIGDMAAAPARRDERRDDYRYDDRHDERYRDDRRHDSYGYRDKHYKKKRKESFLEDLFDF